jgi:hypothetical protein
MTPLSYSMVVRAAVDPGMKRVTEPFLMADSPAFRRTRGVRSIISVFAVVFTKMCWTSMVMGVPLEVAC